MSFAVVIVSVFTSLTKFELDQPVCVFVVYNILRRKVIRKAD